MEVRRDKEEEWGRGQRDKQVGGVCETVHKSYLEINDLMRLVKPEKNRIGIATEGWTTNRQDRSDSLEMFEGGVGKMEMKRKAIVKSGKN